MQHVAEAVVQQGVANMHDTGAAVSQHQAQHAFEVLENNVEHNVDNSQDIHAELQVKF